MLLPGGDLADQVRTGVRHIGNIPAVLNGPFSTLDYTFAHSLGYIPKAHVSASQMSFYPNYSIDP
jgi:hypothetical protein